MELPEADKWREATQMKFDSLLTLGVFERIPLSKVPPGAKLLGTRWVFKLNPTGCSKDASLYKVGVKFLGLTVVEPTLLSVDLRIIRCYLP